MTSAPPLDLLAAERLDWVKTLARSEQVEPAGDWTTWLYLAGRGAGKTRSCAEWLAWKAVSKPGTRCAIIARTYADARDTCAEGESGILGVLRRYRMLDNYNRSIGEIVLSNKSRIKLFSAEEPDRLRGPQHEYIWADELAAWQYDDTWDQAQFGLRLGEHPQVAIATTPRPTPLLKRIIADEHTVVTKGTTYDNLANLAPTVRFAILQKYEGTRLGRQELMGELLDDVEGALWHAALIDEHRVGWQHLKNLKSPRQESPSQPSPQSLPNLPGLTNQQGYDASATAAPDEKTSEKSEQVEIVRIVVAIDPAVTSGENSDETGIIVVGKGDDNHGYVLADLTCKDTPLGWARRAVQAWHDYGEIGPIVAEGNQGGDLIETTLRSVEPHIPFKKVTAKQGKRLRAEPVSALYEQGRVHHVGTHSKLEDQMTSWLPDSGLSPDRLDALVHGIVELDLARGSSADRWFSEIAPPCMVCSYPMAPSEATCKNCGTRRKEPA